MKERLLTVAVPSKANVSPSFTSVTAPTVEVAMEPMRRKLVWIEEQYFWGWRCSECAWLFRPLGPLVGQSIDEMKVHYEQQRDNEFASHICAEHGRASKNPG